MPLARLVLVLPALQEMMVQQVLLDLRAMTELQVPQGLQVRASQDQQAPQGMME